jgi:2-dehydro-3-deoxyphosphogluconate aldolase / (4S)-4-hydroxy-2-oxoglutarate aldolase
VDKQTILTSIAELGLLAVLRAPDPAGARRAVDALVEAGVLGIEITYSTPDAASVIAAVKQSYGDEVLVGAGTLVTRAQVAEAAEAGASYLVSPGLDDDVVASMRATSLPAMAGVLTPTEVMRGVRLSVDVMKLFPGSLGGPSYLRSLRGPFPDVPFMPTGGVSADNVGDWLAAGAIAVGAGSELASAGNISSGDFAAIREKGRRFVAAIREVRADAAPRASR